MTENRRNHLAWIWTMVVLSVALSVFSIVRLHGAVWPIPGAGPSVFWISLTVWALALTVLVVKPFNIGVLRMAGGLEPDAHAWQYLAPLWRQVQRQAGVDPGRYVLLLVEDDYPIHRDLGSYVVAVSRESMALNPKELSAVLAQRLARQVGFAAPAVGLCLWAALPIALLLGIAIVAFLIIRAVSRIVFNVADNLNPKTESQAAVGCILFLVALFGLIFVFATGVAIALQAAIVLVAMIAIAWLARQADLRMNDLATDWGYGSDLLAAVKRPEADKSTVTVWLRPFYTYGARETQIARIERLLWSQKGGPA